MYRLFILFAGSLSMACGNFQNAAPAFSLANNFLSEATPLINPSGKTVEARFTVPAGFVRLPAGAADFGAYLRRLPLLPDSAPVHLYNGSLKNRQDVHCAVLDLDVGRGNLQQCADAIIRIRAEYLFGQKRYADIHFRFTNGFVAEYARWRRGERIRVEGNRAFWIRGRQASESYSEFRQFLDIVFTYAGTASLERELAVADPVTLRPGDVWIEGGHPGHAVIVLDVAANPQTGARCFLLAQSYMPAQEIHILRNPASRDGNPWYFNTQTRTTLETPEWTFATTKLRRFP